MERARSHFFSFLLPLTHHTASHNRRDEREKEGCIGDMQINGAGAEEEEERRINVTLHLAPPHSPPHKKGGEASLRENSAQEVLSLVVDVTGQDLSG